MTDLEKTTDYSGSFSGTVANDPTAREQLKVLLTKFTIDLRHLYGGAVFEPEGESPASVYCDADFSGWTDAVFHFTADDVPPTRYDQQHPAPPVDPTSNVDPV